MTQTYDETQWAAAAMDGIEMPLTDQLSFQPSLRAWDTRGGRTAKDLPQAPAYARTSTWVPGDEQADRTARRKGVDLAAPSGWEQVAASQLGSPYVWATTNPQGAAGGPGSGFDCSGYTQWVYKRAFGVNLPHLSSAQQGQLKSVSKENLQPGDLVFFHYSNRNGAGTTADHVGIYAGNGQMYAASSSNGQVVKQAVDWAHFVGGGQRPGGGAVGTSEPSQSGRRGTSGASESLPNAAFAAAGIGMDLYLTAPAAVAAHLAHETSRDSTRTSPDFGSGTKAEIKRQLYEGFMDAGRADLARMVKTKAFDTWIAAESGWRVDSVSQYYEGHGRNYGLFQFWDGHAWTSDYYKGGDWTMSAYDQAKAVAKYFDLTPNEIRTYANEINNHDYHGWG